MAPALFASGLNREAMLKYSMASYSEQLKLQSLLGKLASQSAGATARADSSKDAFFANLDDLATILFDSATVQDSLDDNLRQMAGLSQELIARRALTARLSQLSAQVLLLTVVRDGDSFQKLAASVRQSLHALQADSDPRIGTVVSLVDGPEGILKLREDLLRLTAEVRSKLVDNKSLATEFIRSTDLISDELTLAVAQENELQQANLAERSWLLKSIAAVSVLLVLGTAAYVQFSVMSRLSKLVLAMRGDSPRLKSCRSQKETTRFPASRRHSAISLTPSRGRKLTFSWRARSPNPLTMQKACSWPP